uniref:Uncharacterized protein n=1 Tax=Tetraselmis sp. GSL018 TaxID=582737 RepID=A0A061SAL2_9CHLO
MSGPIRAVNLLKPPEADTVGSKVQREVYEQNLANNDSQRQNENKAVGEKQGGTLERGSKQQS